MLFRTFSREREATIAPTIHGRAIVGVIGANFLMRKFQKRAVSALFALAWKASLSLYSMREKVRKLGVFPVRTFSSSLSAPGCQVGTAGRLRDEPDGPQSGFRSNCVRLRRPGKQGDPIGAVADRLGLVMRERPYRIEGVKGLATYGVATVPRSWRSRNRADRCQAKRACDTFFENRMKKHDEFTYLYSYQVLSRQIVGK